MDPREFITLASLLASGNAKASSLRSASSRAYYGAHHVAAEILRGMGFTIRQSGSGHADVWNRLQNSGDEEIIMVGSQLSNLQVIRNKADYDVRRLEAERQSNVREHVAQAKQIISIVEQQCLGPRRNDIIRAIQAWEKLTGN